MIRSTAARRLPAVALALAGCGLVAACAAGSTTQGTATTSPAGAVTLTQNLPTPVDGYRLVAANIDDDGAAVTVEPPEGAAATLDVVAGQRYTSSGLTFDVLSVTPDDQEGAQPGALAGTVVVLVVGTDAG